MRGCSRRCGGCAISAIRVIVVEHDEDAILAADHVVDVGPGAGIHGGEIIAQGTPHEIMANPKSLTGQYLTGARKCRVPRVRRKPRAGAQAQDHRRAPATI